MRRLALVLGSLASTLLCVEMLLQGVAVAWRWSSPTPRIELRGSGARILVLGDSNPFGLYDAADAAFPRLFERSWNERHPDRSVTVKNMAFPGTSTWKLWENLDRILEAFQPSIVLLMVGVNDFQTVAGLGGAEAEKVVRAGALAAVYSRAQRGIAWKLSRTVRLVSTALGALAAHSALPWASAERPASVAQGDDQPAAVAAPEGLPRPAFRMKPQKGLRPDPGGDAGRTALLDGHAFELATPFVSRSSPGWYEVSHVVLEQIVRRIRESGRQVLLLTYPSSAKVYGALNERTRTVAKTTGVPLLDLGREFEERCRREACDKYFRLEHPVGRGQNLVADALVRDLERSGMGDPSP